MDGMWTFLLVGSVGAVGAAMAVGTLAALVRWYRTGQWPGRLEGTEVSTGRVVGLWARVVVGAVVAVAAYLSLAGQGLVL